MLKVRLCRPDVRCFQQSKRKEQPARPHSLSQQAPPGKAHTDFYQNNDQYCLDSCCDSDNDRSLEKGGGGSVADLPQQASSLGTQSEGGSQEADKHSGPTLASRQSKSSDKSTQATPPDLKPEVTV